MEIRALIEKNRSYRRFRESERITAGQVTRWLELARFSASGRNMQPLKYAVSLDRELNGAIFPFYLYSGFCSSTPGCRSS